MPQYGQIHGLLGKGAQVIESMLPGWKAVALQLGAMSFKPGLNRTVSCFPWTTRCNCTESCRLSAACHGI